MGVGALINSSPFRVLLRRGSWAQVGGNGQWSEVRVEGLACSLPPAIERDSPHAVTFVPAGGVVREETLEHCCWYHGEPEATLLVRGRQLDGSVEQGAEAD